MFLSITFDREVIEAYEGHQSVSLIKTHRMIYNLTHPGHLVTLTSGQLLTLTFQDHHIHVSMRLDKANTMVPKSALCQYWLGSFSRKLVEQNNYILKFEDRWRLKVIKV